MRFSKEIKNLNVDLKRKRYIEGCGEDDSRRPSCRRHLELQLIHCNAIRAPVVGRVMHRDLRAADCSLILLPLSITSLYKARHRFIQTNIHLQHTAQRLFTHWSHFIALSVLPTKFIFVVLTIVSASTIWKAES